jgi:shikimate kinase
MEISMSKTNIVLIGMPSSGKSTVGALLAEKLKMKFIDTDAVIKQIENKELKDIVNDEGHKKFLEKQESAILGLDLEEHVIATGGSVVFGDISMEHLKKNGKVIYLMMTLSEIEQRVTPERRFAREKGKSLRDVYEERRPLYEKYSDLTINCSNKGVEEIVSEITDIL